MMKVLLAIVLAEAAKPKAAFATFNRLKWVILRAPLEDLEALTNIGGFDKLKIILDRSIQDKKIKDTKEELKEYIHEEIEIIERKNIKPAATMLPAGILAIQKAKEEAIQGFVREIDEQKGVPSKIMQEEEKAAADIASDLVDLAEEVNASGAPANDEEMAAKLNKIMVDDIIRNVVGDAQVPEDTMTAIRATITAEIEKIETAEQGGEAKPRKLFFGALLGAIGPIFAQIGPLIPGILETAIPLVTSVLGGLGGGGRV